MSNHDIADPLDDAIKNNKAVDEFLEGVASTTQPELRRNLPAIGLVIYAVVGIATIVVWGTVSMPDAKRAGNQTTQADAPPLSTVSGTKISPTRSAATETPLINDGFTPANKLQQRGEASPVPAPQSTSKETTALPPAGDGSAEVKMPLPLAEASPLPAPQSTSVVGKPPLPTNAGSAEAKAAPQSTSVGTTPSFPADDGSAQANAPPPLAKISPTPQSNPSRTVSGALVLDNDEIATLLKRSKLLLTNGDLASARLLLVRAAEAGSAEAALELGATFDPLVLQQRGAVGIVPDTTRARKWYQRAAELGSTAATQQLAKLDRMR